MLSNSLWLSSEFQLKDFDLFSRNMISRDYRSSYSCKGYFFATRRTQIWGLWLREVRLSNYWPNPTLFWYLSLVYPPPSLSFYPLFYLLYLPISSITNYKKKKSGVGERKPDSWNTKTSGAVTWGWGDIINLKAIPWDGANGEWKTEQEDIRQRDGMSEAEEEER